MAATDPGKEHRMTINLNRVTITGYIVQDPELIDLPAGQQACELRIACNRR